MAGRLVDSFYCSCFAADAAAAVLTAVSVVDAGILLVVVLVDVELPWLHVFVDARSGCGCI